MKRPSGEYFGLLFLRDDDSSDSGRSLEGKVPVMLCRQMLVVSMVSV